MGYNKTNWQDRIPTYPGRFSATGSVPGNITLTLNDVPSQSGTPFNAAAMMNIENALDRIINNQNPNLLFNPSGRLGYSGWTLSGANGSPQAWSTGLGTNGEGGYFYVSSSTPAALSYWDSAHIPMNAGKTLTLSGDLCTIGQTAGNPPTVEIHCFNSSGGDLLSCAAINLANGQPWTKVAGTGTTPANTAYVTIRMIYWGNSISTFSAYRKLKVEVGSNSTTFSDDNTLNTTQYTNALINALLQVAGIIATTHNTLDDGSGNAAFTGNITAANMLSSLSNALSGSQYYSTTGSGIWFTTSSGSGFSKTATGSAETVEFYFNGGTSTPGGMGSVLAANILIYRSTVGIPAAGAATNSGDVQLFSYPVTAGVPQTGMISHMVTSGTKYYYYLAFSAELSNASVTVGASGSLLVLS